MFIVFQVRKHHAQHRLCFINFGVGSLTPAPQSTPFVTSWAYMPLTFKAVYPINTILIGMFHVCSLLEYFGIASLLDGTSSSFSLYNELWRKSAFCFLNIFSVRGRVWGRTKPYVLCLDPICFYVSCKTQMVWEW